MTGPPKDPQDGSPDGSPDGLPDTASPKEAARWWVVILAAGLGALVLALLSMNLFRTWNFPSGEESNGGGVESVVVSGEESSYLPPDVERFGRRPEAVYVYVVVRRIPSGVGLRVRVERERSDSMFSSIFSGEDRGVVLESLETRPGPGENLDVARFVLREKSGGRISPGRYTIRVYREPDRNGEAEPVARKFFQIRG